MDSSHSLRLKVSDCHFQLYWIYAKDYDLCMRTQTWNWKILLISCASTRLKLISRFTTLDLIFHKLINFMNYRPHNNFDLSARKLLFLYLSLSGLSTSSLYKKTLQLQGHSCCQYIYFLSELEKLQSPQRQMTSCQMLKFIEITKHDPSTLLLLKTTLSAEDDNQIIWWSILRKHYRLPLYKLLL